MNKIFKYYLVLVLLLLATASVGYAMRSGLPLSEAEGRKAGVSVQFLGTDRISVSAPIPIKTVRVGFCDTTRIDGGKHIYTTFRVFRPDKTRDTFNIRKFYNGLPELKKQTEERYRMLPVKEVMLSTGENQIYLFDGPAPVACVRGKRTQSSFLYMPEYRGQDDIAGFLMAIGTLGFASFVGVPAAILAFFAAGALGGAILIAILRLADEGGAGIELGPSSRPDVTNIYGREGKIGEIWPSAKPHVSKILFWRR